MHGNILNQRFNYFSINAYKNYSKLDEKPSDELEKRDKLNDDDLFSTFMASSLTFDRRRSLSLRPKGSSKKNANYFYSTIEDYESVYLTPYFKDSKSFLTLNENQLKRHYGNPFSGVETNIFERTITLTGDHLSIRVNKYTKTREVNCKYFRKSNIIYGIKLNLKTGSFITYSTNGNRRRKNSVIRQNSFKHLKEIISSIFFEIRLNDYRNAGSVYKSFKEQINDEVFIKTIYHTICSLLDTEDLFDNHPPQSEIEKFMYESIIKLFIKLKRIKTPNNYIGYLTEWYPTQKYLKKNENKLILAILDRLKLKSKSLNKLLHEIPEVNIRNLITLSKLFGYGDLHKYIHNLDKRFLSVKQGQLAQVGMFGYESLNNHFEYNLTSDEKSRLLKLLNSFFFKTDINDKQSNYAEQNSSIEHQFIQITDHVSMISKIKEYIPNIEFRAQNFKDFHHEHLEYSKIERSIQKGYTIQYTFDDKLIKHIEEEMKLLLDTNEIASFYPVILKTDTEYSEEGKHMHHCVATYADREQSIIVSIRDESPFGTERVTCEFDARTKTLVQAKSFCNARPPERFQLAIDELCHRVNIFRGSIKSTGKEKAPLIINGIQIPLKENDRQDTLDFIFNQF